MCAKKRNDFRQLKRSIFRVEKCKTEKNLSKFLNNMAYKTVTSMRDCVMKRNFMLNMNNFYFDKMHMLYNQNNSRVKSCKKNSLKKPIVFPKKPLVSNMCTFLSHCFETKNYHCLSHTVGLHGFREKKLGSGVVLVWYGKGVTKLCNLPKTKEFECAKIVSYETLIKPRYDSGDIFGSADPELASFWTLDSFY